LAQEITLKSAAQKAVASNPEVLQKWHAYQAAASEQDAAAGGYLPRVDLSASPGREHRDDPLLKSDYTRHSVTLSLTQMLYDGFATRNEVKRLDHARQVRYFELLDASETAALEATRAYLDVLRYRRLVGLAEDNYVRHRALFGQIQKKAEAGVARRVDLEQASGRLALAESNLLVETSNLHDVSARYQRLVGDTPGKEMAPPPALTAGLPGDGATLFKAAQARNPAIEAAIENLRSADAAKDVRKAAYQPRLDLRLRNDRGNNLNGYLGSTDNRTAELLVTWNLFNGFSDRARVRQYTDQIEVAKDLRDKVCRDVRQTGAIAYNDTRKLTEQLTYLDQHQLSTEKARDAYRKQFDIGQRSLLDLLDTENEYFQSRRAYVNADYDLQIAQARTQAGFGNLLATLDLSRVAKDELPDLANWAVDGDGAERCPPEGPTLYTVDKAALDARAAEEVRLATQQTAAAAAPPVAPAATPADDERDVSAALKKWVDAWANRDTNAYQALYANGFRAADGGGRDGWLARRSQAIEGAKTIAVALSDVHVATMNGNQAVTRFRQSYQSDSYRDVVTKVLRWEKIDGRWQIVREAIEGAPQVQ
jgi:adhesin transport system outer membrane protein